MSGQRSASSLERGFSEFIPSTENSGGEWGEIGRSGSEQNLAGMRIHSCGGFSLAVGDGSGGDLFLVAGEGSYGVERKSPFFLLA